MAYRKGDIGLPPVYIVIVNWNGKGYLPPLFTSLFNMSYKNFRIIFVDNGSRDGSAEWVKKFYPETVIIQNKRNLGFAEGNNIGIRYALKSGAKYIALLNTDMVVDKNWLKEMVKPMESDKNIGLVGSKILFIDYPWLINSTGSIINSDMDSRDRDFGKVDGEIKREYGEVLGISAGAMLVRTDIFKRIGLFDKWFFAYYEDTEFSLRIRRYTGYRIVYNPNAVVYHKFWGVSSLIPIKREFLISRNHYMVMFRYLPLRKIPFRVLRILKVRVERNLFFEDIFREWVAFLSASSWFIPAMVKRLILDIRYKIRYAYINMLEKTKGIPLGAQFPPDYAERRENLFPENLPSRIIFGVNDNFIGNGWSVLIEKEGLQFRKIVCDSAEVYLSSPKSANLFLQIHLLTDNYIKLYLEGKMISNKIWAERWETVVFPVKVKKVQKYYKIKIEGKNTLMNEIALLEPFSLLLRRKK